jgi:anaerobic selenocysteine-containing dehydrogenase
MEAAWPKLELYSADRDPPQSQPSDQRQGRLSIALPQPHRGRDVQASGAQAVSVEDSTSCIHGSRGKARPASPFLRSEPAIVAGIATQILAANPKLDWDAWVADYARIRDAIEQTYPDVFQDFNERLFTPGGFWKGNKAAERIWLTPSKKAEFFAPPTLSATGFADAEGRFRLMTLRSNDQFNTTIYGYHDRFRGVKGTRDVLFMHESDIQEAGLVAGQVIALESDAQDGKRRRREGLIVTPYDIPRGCLGAYYPESNVLMPVDHHAEESHVPAAKSVPVRIAA